MYFAKLVVIGDWFGVCPRLCWQLSASRIEVSVSSRGLQWYFMNILIFRLLLALMVVNVSQAEQALEDRLKDAQKRHSEYLQTIKGKAGNENAKVFLRIFS